MKKFEVFILVFYFYNISFEKCFLISVIMAIYNTGRYLDDSIGSLLNQTINFNEIQIILVNDGSIDNTEEICLKYQTKYPKNIFYIKIIHSGVSIARNEGMKYANGTYINFLDPDDKWDSLALKYILLFFKFNNNIDFVAGRIKFFEARDDYHPLDFKYYKTRILNLTEEYNCIQLSVSCCVFKKTLIKNKIFKEGVFSGEDARFVLSILLLNPIMGIIRESIYFYRRRADSSSTVQTQKKIKSFYFETLNSVTNYLINKSLALYSKIIPFIQYYIAYDILFRIQSLAYKYLDKENLQKYILLIENLLNKIDDKYVLEQKSLSNNYKILALSKKHKTDLRKNMKFEHNSFIYSEKSLINLRIDRNIIMWKILDVKNNIIHLEGKDNFWMPRENYYYFCKLRNTIYYPRYKEYYNYNFETMYGTINKGRIVLFDIPFGLEPHPLVIKFYLSYNGVDSEIFTSFGFFSHIPPISNGYYISGNLLIKYLNKRLILFHYNKKLGMDCEKQYCEELNNINKNNIIKIRKKIRILRRNKNKNIWIINDNYNKAGDNGEYFFRFLKKKNPKELKIYFAISGKSPDFFRLKKYGNILDLESDEYMNIFLKADKIITSTSNSWAYNPFKEEHKFLRDLLVFLIIFLNNGIIKDDLSKFLNRLDTQFSLFMTSSEKEYKSIINKKYGYDERNIIITGLPRYDNLFKFKNIIKKERIILIMPTWRLYIQGTMDLLTYKNTHSDFFNCTNFFIFYNDLINNKDLILIMKRFDFKGVLCLHPYFSSQWTDFNQNQIFSVSGNCNFQKILLKSSLLITDYSNVFFDFGYLKKPVIYTHFDYNEYRNNHFQKGYFDYEKNGFGPICKDIQCTIKEIIFSIKKHCLLGKKYIKRINKFFKYSDGKNNERIFEEIINVENRKIENRKNSVNFLLIFTSLVFFYKFIKII